MAAPGVLVAVVPKFACPACAAAAFGILSSFGLGYVLTATYLLPITAVLLIAAVAALLYRASTRHGYGPFAVGSAAAAMVLLGKFKWESEALMYSGIGLLIIGSVWNAWPGRVIGTVPCPDCDQSKLMGEDNGEQKKDRGIQRRM